MQHGFIGKQLSANSCFSFRVEFESVLFGRRDPSVDGSEIQLTTTVISETLWKIGKNIHIVDGSEILHQLIWEIFQYLQGFMHVRWFSRRISEPSTVSTGVRRISEPVTATVSAAIGGLWKLLEPRRFQENLIGFLRGDVQGEGVTGEP